MSGKGDRPRPCDQERFARNYRKIYGERHQAFQDIYKQTFKQSPQEDCVGSDKPVDWSDKKKC